MGYRSGKYSSLERRTALSMEANGFTLQEICEILNRESPISLGQCLLRWKRKTITVATDAFECKNCGFNDGVPELQCPVCHDTVKH